MAANGWTPSVPWSAGDGTLFATGIFTGGTVKLQVSPDGATWLDAKDDSDAVITLSGPGVINFSVGNGFVRGHLSGGTGPTVWITIVPR